MMMTKMMTKTMIMTNDKDDVDKDDDDKDDNRQR